MLIIPAIDLHEGRCVRLLEGRFDAVTRYGDPIAQLGEFEATGAAWVHIVDLDGAKMKAPAQHDLIARLVAESGLKIQCGGGVRAREHVATLLGAGVARVVVGSVAAREPERVRDWIAEFGAESLCLAFDVRAVGTDWHVAADAWTANAGKTLSEALNAFPPGEAAHVLVTDISRDGALVGPNVALMAHLHGERPDITFQASGGVQRLDDLRALREAGAAATIVGRALYERLFSLEDALAL